jgi:23S rRNA A1618 N6-methylase RlmF
LVANWFKLKARVDDSEATTKELKKSADYLEDMIVQKMEEQELDKVSTKLGSVTLKQKSMPSVKDIVSFIKWVSEDVDNRVGFIQKRVNEAAINEMLENEGMLPPGVDTYIKPKLNKRSAK